MGYLFVLGFAVAGLLTYLFAPDYYVGFMGWLARTLGGRPS